MIGFLIVNSGVVGNPTTKERVFRGTKKSLEPLHVQYTCDFHSVAVVNSTLNSSSGLKVRAAVTDIHGTQQWSKSAVIDVPSDGVVRACTIPGLTNLSKAYFVRLRVLQNLGGPEILPSMWSDNYVSLLPGETRMLTARWRAEDATGAVPTVAVDGWNVVRK